MLQFISSFLFCKNINIDPKKSENIEKIENTENQTKIDDPNVMKLTLELPMKTIMRNEDEVQYLQLIRKILAHGTSVSGRNGLVYSIFGYSMRFSLRDGNFPLLTTKKVAWKTCFRELIWFLNGYTSNQKLQEQGVHIWNDNGTREFLDSRGLVNNKVNDLGPVYGHQWRHFNAEYIDCDTDYDGKGIDQIQNIINALKDPKERYSRRLLLSAWNPCQLEQMVLPPCHVMCQFNVQNVFNSTTNTYQDQLSCALYQRSGDVGLGVPFNIASYSFLTNLIAHYCDLNLGDFVYFLGDAHIYNNHIEALQLQLEREPFAFPKISISPDSPRERIEDYTENDIVWDTNYVSHPSIYMKMVA
jgi:thymidylate synthase